MATHCLPDPCANALIWFCPRRLGELTVLGTALSGSHQPPCSILTTTILGITVPMLERRTWKHKKVKSLSQGAQQAVGRGRILTQEVSLQNPCSQT